MIASSRDRSSAETVNDIPVRISLTRTCQTKWESKFGLLCSAQSTSGEIPTLESAADTAPFRKSAIRVGIKRLILSTSPTESQGHMMI
jgi:hypothetical protein